MPHDMDMNNSTETTAPEREPSPDVPLVGLVRPVNRRIIAGVGSGLADYWNISPFLTRLAFVLLTAVGGLGFLLYVAGWLLIPNDDGTESIAEEALRKARTGESHVGIVLIGLAALIGISTIGGVDGGLAWAVALGVVGYLLYRGDFGQGDGPERDANDHRTARAYRSSRTSSSVLDHQEFDGPPPPPGSQRPSRPPRPPREPRKPRERSILGRLSLAAGLITVGVMASFDNAGAAIEFRHYVAALLVVVSAGLIIGAFAGRARWLIAIGLLLLPAAAVSRWVPGDAWFASVNSIDALRIDPTNVDQIEGFYEFGTGDVVFDLRDLSGESFDLQVEMGAGDLRVLLPDNAGDSNIRLTMGAGQITVDTGEGPTPQVQVEVGIGGINAPGPDQGGFGLTYGNAGDSAGNVRVELGIGQVDITN